MNKSSKKPLFLENGVKKSKDYILKTRLEDTIIRCGISKREFYERILISRSYWWRISWGVDNFPVWLKTKLCNEFGKPFIDFFLIQEEEKKNIRTNDRLGRKIKIEKVNEGTLGVSHQKTQSRAGVKENA